jgi:hypothetical protein
LPLPSSPTIRKPISGANSIPIGNSPDRRPLIRAAVFSQHAINEEVEELDYQYLWEQSHRHEDWMEVDQDDAMGMASLPSGDFTPLSPVLGPQYLSLE